MSANSIIRVYQNTANTTANSSKAEISRYRSQYSPEYIHTPDSLVKDIVEHGDGFGTNTGTITGTGTGTATTASVSTSAYIEQTHPLILQKVENLPTAPILKESPQLSNHQPTYHHAADKSGSSVQSFFTIPLKFFNAKLGGLLTSDSVSKQKQDIEKFDDDVNAVENLIDELKNTLPINVISQSPVEPLNIGGGSNEIDSGYGGDSAEKTNSELLKSSNQTELDPESNGYDPIYDTYISYLQHTSPTGELPLDEDGIGNFEPVYEGDTAVDHASIIGNLEVDNAGAQANGNVDKGEENNETNLEPGSTLHRLSSKTLRLLRQFSNKYSSGPVHPSTPALPSNSPATKQQNDQSQHSSTFRSELKRCLSNVSIRRHGSSKRWKSNQHENEDTNQDLNNGAANQQQQQQNSQPATFRSELKRRLSNVSIRRYNSSKRGKTANCEANEIQQGEHQDAPRNPCIPRPRLPPVVVPLQANSGNTYKSKFHTLSKQEEGLAELFESEDFASRLSLGAVSSRKQYSGDQDDGIENHGDDPNETDDLYHISYRRTDLDDDNLETDDEGLQDPREDFDPTNRIRKQQTKAGQLNLAIQDTILYVKDQTTKRSRSFNQQLNKIFQVQET